VRARRRLAWLLATAGLLLAAGAAAAPWYARHRADRDFVEHRLPAGDIPTAIAAAPDGTVWFTIEGAAALGRVRDGRVERLPKARASVEPLGLAVDAAGAAWFTEAPDQAVSRMSPDGAVWSFPLGTPIARLARLAVAPDGAVWFTEGTAFSVTRLAEGRLVRHEVGGLTAGPFGVAVDGRGAAWATLQGANRLVRVDLGGETTAYDIPTRASGPTDVAVDGGGAVWFLEFRGNRIGRLAEGRFAEFEVPTARAGLSGLAVAPDGALWFGEVRAGALGRLRDGAFAEFRLPRADARPFGVAVDPAGNVWYADLKGVVGMLRAGRAR
jgi:virginiamycin B lyase